MKVVSLTILTILVNFSSQMWLEEIISKTDYHTLLILGGRLGTNLPQVVGSGSNPFKLQTKFNAQVLAIIFLEDLEQINSLRVYLDDIIESKIIVVMENRDFNELDVFERCWSHGLMNVVVMTKDNILTFSPFEDPPNITIKKIHHPFEEPSRNYHNYNISCGAEGLAVSAAFGDLMHESKQYFKRKFNLTFGLTTDSSDVILTSAYYYKAEDNEPREPMNYFEFDKVGIIVPRNTFINKYLYFLAFLSNLLFG